MITKTGIIEDRFDPEGRGQVRVRIQNLHSEFEKYDDFQGYSTQDLPWYEVKLPVTAGTISGIGQSPKGLIEGTIVEVTFEDEDLYVGRVSAIIPTAKRPIQRGQNKFADPTGLYPTKQNQNDTNSLSGFDYSPGKSKPGSVQATNNELGLAIRPDGTIITDENLDNNPNYTIYEMIRHEEGFRPKMYRDHLGYPTIGIGHLVVLDKGASWSKANEILSQQIGRKIETTGGPGSINPEEVEDLFTADLISITKAMNRFPQVVAAMNAAGDNNPRKWALISMAFQMGPAGLAKFNTSLGLMAAGQWKEASVQIRESKWAKQTPSRALRTSVVLASGNMLAYGCPVTERSRNVRAVIFNMSSQDIPWAAVNFDEMEPFADCEDPVYKAKMAFIDARKSVYEGWLRSIGVIEAAIKDISEQISYMYDYVALKVDAGLDFLNEQFKKATDLTKKLIAYVNEKVSEFIVLAEEKGNEFIEWAKTQIKDLTNGFDLPSINNDCDPKNSRKPRTAEDNSPWVPAGPNNSPVMFVEPESAWAAQYPYNNVTQTEGGHIIEIDDTPGHERMHWKSGSGIYEEWRPDGKRVTKVVDEDYKFVGSNNNLEVSGHQNTNIKGDAQTYIIGNSIVTVAANGELNIFGNDKINIQGNQDVFIKGNQNVTVEGNVVINVNGTSTINNKGDVTLNAEANVNANIKGNMTSDISGNWDVKAGGNISLVAGGNTFIDGSRIDLG